MSPRLKQAVGSSAHDKRISNPPSSPSAAIIPPTQRCMTASPIGEMASTHALEESAAAEDAVVGHGGCVWRHAGERFPCRRLPVQVCSSSASSMGQARSIFASMRVLVGFDGMICLSLVSFSIIHDPSSLPQDGLPRFKNTVRHVLPDHTARVHTPHASLIPDESGRGKHTYGWNLFGYGNGVRRH